MQSNPFPSSGWKTIKYNDSLCADSTSIIYRPQGTKIWIDRGIVAVPSFFVLHLNSGSWLMHLLWVSEIKRLNGTIMVREGGRWEGNDYEASENVWWGTVIWGQKEKSHLQRSFNNIWLCNNDAHGCKYSLFSSAYAYGRALPSYYFRKLLDAGFLCKSFEATVEIDMHG